MNFFQAVSSALRQYVGFSGRARRSEYWWFALFQVVVYVAAAIVDASLQLGFVYPVVLLALLLPSIAVTVRRLHDTGRSGWWFLFGCVPLVGSITLIVFACQDSERDDNRFGPWPKHGDFAATPAAPAAEAPLEA